MSKIKLSSPTILFDKEKRAQRRANKELIKQEKYYLASQWQLMYRKLKKHKLATFSITILALLYIGVIFGGFIATQGLEDFSASDSNAPPSKVHLYHEGKFIGPFVYGNTFEFDEYEQKIFKEDKSQPYRLKLFVKGTEYKLFGLLKSDIHLFGVDNSQRPEGKDPVNFFIFGADGLGRDLFSRIILGSKVSLTVPLVGTGISFVLAIIIGGISGYYGGWIDLVIQRIIEVMMSFPTLPLWMALSAAIPPDISISKVYLYITVIMSLLAWPGLARVVRSKFMSLKNDDYILAAKLCGVKDSTIVIRHLVPGFMSYLIVNLTIGIPGMILGETTMSFLGLGMRAPATSWGVLLQECQSIPNISDHPWKLIPVIFVIITVLAYNFLGDGLRDAADPYK